MSPRVLTLGAVLVGLAARAPTAAADDPISPIIYLNKCAGGCTLHSGASNSQANTSPIPRGGSGTYTLTGFSLGDQVWTDFVDCMREVYAPYGAQIVTEEPGPGNTYHEIMVAGDPVELGLDTDILGVASSLGGIDCTPVNNAISFAFANVHPPSGVYLCATAAQESGHTWGLDHEFDCATPMTYLHACGRQYFRNAGLECGEYASRPCMCGGNRQNSHIRLLEVFGPGQPLPTPTTTLTNPTGSTVTDEFTISASGQAVRGLGHAELWLNGYKWAEKPGNFKSSSLAYVFTAAAEVPDGVIDVEVRVFDDLEIGYGSAQTTVTKGAPCTTSETCLTGQKCDAGKCYWDPPTGQMGEACSYPQFCQSGVCAGEICTESCNATVTGDCPVGWECVDLGGGAACQQAEDKGGGGCDAGDGSPGPMVIVLALVGVAGLVRPGRRSIA